MSAGQTLGELLYNNEKYRDVMFLVGKDLTPFPAHRIVLASRSSVFDRMFCWSWADEPIPIPDVEPTIFQLLLRFIYTDKAELTGENVLAAMYIAKKYAVVELEQLTIEFLESNICPDNVITILEAAAMYEAIDTEDKCLDVLDERTKEVIKSEDFLTSGYNTLMMIVKRDSLNVDEVDLFEAVVKWAEAECIHKNVQPTSSNKRTCLNKLLFEIRFPVMDSVTFLQVVVKCGILTENEVNNVLRYHSRGRKVDPIFKTRKRRYEMKAVFTIPLTEIHDAPDICFLDKLVSPSSGAYKAVCSWQMGLVRCGGWNLCSNDNFGQSRRGGCCVNACIYLKSSHELICKNSWLELVNYDRAKNIKIVLTKELMHNRWNENNIIQYDTLMNPSSGFSINGALRIKLHLKVRPWESIVNKFYSVLQENHVD